MEEKFLSVFIKVGGMGMLGGALFQALFEQNAWRKEVAWKMGILAPPVYGMRMDYCARLVGLS